MNVYSSVYSHYVKQTIFFQKGDLEKIGKKGQKVGCEWLK